MEDSLHIRDTLVRLEGKVDSVLQVTAGHEPRIGALERQAERTVDNTIRIQTVEATLKTHSDEIASHGTSLNRLKGAVAVLLLAAPIAATTALKLIGGN